MKTSLYTLLPKDELGFCGVNVELEPCPLCNAKHDDFHTRRVYMVAWERRPYYNAKVKCLNCGLEIVRCTEPPTGSLDESIRRVHSAWNRREGLKGRGDVSPRTGKEET